MADVQNKPGDKPATKADKYEGLDVPQVNRNPANDPNVTVEGGAFWINGELRNANGEMLSPERIAEFKELKGKKSE